MLVTLPNSKVNKDFHIKLYFPIAFKMPFSTAATVMIPALRGALLSRTATSATVAFRHMSAGPGFDYVKVNGELLNLQIFYTH